MVAVWGVVVFYDIYNLINLIQPNQPLTNSKKYPLRFTGRGLCSSKSVSRVLFRRLKGEFYHLSGPAIADRFKQPTHPDDLLLSRAKASNFRFRTYLVFQLLRFTAIPVARKSRELLPHVFTLTRPPAGGRAVYFLWHLLSPAAGAFPLGSRILYVARTFLSRFWP